MHPSTPRFRLGFACVKVSESLSTHYRFFSFSRDAVSFEARASKWSFSSSTVIINAGGALIVKYKELGAKKTVNSLEKQIFQLGNLEKKIESILDWLQSIFLQKNGKRNDLSLTGFKWQCKSMQELKFKDSGRQFEQNRDR